MENIDFQINYNLKYRFSNEISNWKLKFLTFTKNLNVFKEIIIQFFYFSRCII